MRLDKKIVGGIVVLAAVATVLATRKTSAAAGIKLSNLNIPPEVYPGEEAAITILVTNDSN